MKRIACLFIFGSGLLILVNSANSYRKAYVTESPKTKVKFQYSVFLDPERKYFMSWITNDTHITLELQVATLGWIGFGLSPNGGMTGSDIAVMWVDNGKVTLQDRFAEGFFEPRMDEKDDLHLLYGSENETHTVVAFSRRLDTCDEKMDRIITHDLIHLIYAYHSQDPPNGKLMKHEHRGNKNFFFTNPVLNFEVPEYSKKMTFLANKYKVPYNTQTTYRCFISQLKGIDKNHHLIAFQPNFDPKNPDLVHHMALHLCETSFKNEKKVKEFMCYGDPVSLGIMMHCFTSYIAVFTAGGLGFIYPPEVGVLITSKLNNRYVVLELHYNNQKLMPGIVDSTGFDLYLSDKLRKYNSQTLTLGNLDFNWGIIIPPRQKEFTIYGLCDSQCFNNFEVPDEGLTAFAFLLHTHLAGYRVRLKLIRNGKELKNVMTEENYKFDYQEFRTLREPIKLYRNDTLLLECVYTTVDRENYTLGGLSTSEEMCAAQILYYPKTEFTACGSINNYKILVKRLGLKNTEIEQTSVVDLMTLNLREKSTDVRQIVSEQLNTPEGKKPEKVPLISNILTKEPVHILCKFMALPQFLEARLPIYEPWVDPPSTCPAN